MFLNHLFNKAYPKLDWIQVEVSSFCDGKCIYCPHTEYRTDWKNMLLPVELYRNIIPAFKNTGLIYLQGWGEPFTHPDFIDFLRLAKKAGCMAGTTTNGTLLNREKIRELVEEGLDIICFSLAGIDEKNDEIRKGTQISKVLECIKEIHRVKNNLSVDKPKVHIAYMLLKSGLHILGDLPPFLENHGISQTVISSLSFPVNREMERESILAKDHKELQDLLEQFQAVKNDAEKRNTELHFNIQSHLAEPSLCAENVDRALFVGSNGSVSPCVMGQLPVKDDNFFYFKGKKQRIECFSFGNIFDETLNNIWNKKEYKNFVRNLAKDTPGQFCRRCPKRFRVDVPL